MAPTQPINTEHVGSAIITLLLSSLSGKVHTATLGRVEKYDTTTRTGDVLPMLKLANIDGTQSSYPTLRDVPFWTYGTASAGIVIPVARGDFVLLVFCERKTAGFMSNGQESNTTVNQIFDLSDAIAFPGIFPASSDIPTTNDTDITIYNHGSGNIILGDALTAKKLLTEDLLTDITAAMTVIQGVSIPVVWPGLMQLAGLGQTAKAKAQ